MPSQGLKILLTTGVLITAFVGLMWTTMQDGTQYYKHVDEVMVDPDQWVGKRLQVHGFASEISWKPSSLDYRFAIENNGYVVHAEYTGIVPDTFQDESEVVAKGMCSSSSRVASWRSVRRSMRRSRRLMHPLAPPPPASVTSSRTAGPPGWPPTTARAQGLFAESF